MSDPTPRVDRVSHGGSTWRVVSLLGLACAVSYLVRADVAVAQERMAPALGLTMTGMGAITAWGFQLSYTIFQVPGGMLGERFGARTALMLALLGCSVASFATGLMPEAPGAAVTTLVVTRVLLGVSQAAVFPVAAMAVMAYVPADQRVRATSLYIAASALGAALAPLLMAPTMERFGWRAVFLVSGAIGATAAVAWRALMPPPAVRAPAEAPYSCSGSFAISSTDAASPCSPAASGAACRVSAASSARRSSAWLRIGSAGGSARAGPGAA